MAESEIHKRIKWAIAKELMEMGYMAGVEVSVDGARFDVKATKGNDTIVFEVHFTHLSDLWKNHIDGKVEYCNSQESISVQKPDWMNDDTVTEMLMSHLYEDSAAGITISQHEHNTLSKRLMQRRCSRDEADIIIKRGLEIGTIVEPIHGVYELSRTQIDRIGTESEGVLHGKPHSEISKLKSFMDVFNTLSDDGKNDVEQKIFITELLKTEKFNEEEVRSFIKKAMQNGQIYERSAGLYKKA